MFDRYAPSTKRVLEELEDDELRRRLSCFARWQTWSTADADDLVAEALEKVCDPEDKPWDPARGSLFGHMRHVMRDIAINRQRYGPGRFEVLRAQAVSEAEPDSSPQPYEALAERRLGGWLRELGARLLTAVRGDDPLAARVFECAAAGAETAPEIAQALGCSVREAEQAMRRLRYRGGLVRAAAEAELAKEADERLRAWKANPRRLERT